MGSVRRWVLRRGRRDALRGLLCSVLAFVGFLGAPAIRAQTPTPIPDSALHIAFSGLVLNRTTNTFNSTATVTNVSSHSFSGSVSLELPNILPATVQLANATCKIDGIPVLVFSLPQAGLAPGQKLGNILLKFSDPTRIHFAFGHALFAGNICADTLSFHALSDSRPLPDASLLALLLPVLAVDCVPVAQQSPLTLTQAMGSLHTRLDQIAGAGAIEEFLRNNTQTSASTLDALAGGAMAANNGPGALAALLAVNQNEPTNPAHVVNAAGAAALLGMPNEALALLDAADAMGGDFGSPMGFDGKAIALNNRGFALLELGKYSQAQTQLESANAREPFLAEARMNLAVAQFCQGQDAAATLLTAVHRSPGVLTLDEVFDLSQGVAPVVPSLPYPGSAERLRAYTTAWQKIESDVLAKSAAARDRENQARHQVGQEQATDPWPLITIQRVGDISNFGDMLGIPTFDDQSPPGLSTLYAAVSKADATTFTLFEKINADFQTWGAQTNTAAQGCIAQNIALASCEPYLQMLNQGRAQVRQYMSPFFAQEGAYEQAMRAFIDPWYRTLTGLAANLSDPAAHELRVSTAQGDELFQYALVVNRGADIMGSLATWWASAQDPEDLSGAPPTDVSDQPGSDPCSGLLKAAKIQESLFDVVNVTINCEKINLEVSEPGLGPFAQLTIPRSGDWTAFMGVKGSLPGTSAKVGVYLRGNDDSFTDAGIKTSQSFGAGPLKIESPFDMELGIADAMKCPFGFCN
jgi:tetratricopeptide (TPR) repeat protein